LTQSKRQTSADLEQGDVFMDGRVVVYVGDITRQAVAAIVNAANSSLMGGGGVDGAIHRAGGPSILDECREIRRSRHAGGLPTGEAVITTAGNLPASHVIHTVGPVYGEHGGRESELLAACYKNSLALAAKHNLTSIAFPAISTGIYGYPRAEAAAIASQAIEQFLAENEVITEVRLVFFQQNDREVFLDNQQFT
jgi:O-acetyl-ADP-ribose deacetylase (regulator of RNase III)